MRNIIGLSRKSQNGSLSLLGLAMLLLLFDRFWGFIFVSTVFASNAMVYVLFITVLLLFIVVPLRYGPIKTTPMAMLWLPFILFTLMGYFAHFRLQLVTYWYACIIMLLVASVTPFLKQVPYRFLLWSGLFCMLGVFIQLFFPSFYDSRIAVLLITDNIEAWVDGYGFNGFTCQLAKTASILIYGEVVLLYKKDELLVKQFNKKWIYYLLIFLFIGSVFLTGKRLLAGLALVLPFLVYLLSERRGNGKFLILLIVGLVGIAGFNYFSYNVNEFNDNIFLRRFATSYIQANTGGDITSGRIYLYNQALSAFREHPLFGIGVGQFKAYTRAETDVHNTYLQVLCEQGAIGFVIFVIPIVYCLIRTILLFRKIEKTALFNYLQMALALQLVYIIYGLTGNENLGAGFILYFMGIAMAISVEKQYKLMK